MDGRPPDCARISPLGQLRANLGEEGFSVTVLPGRAWAHVSFLMRAAASCVVIDGVAPNHPAVFRADAFSQAT